jgi:hypothetical protein
MPFLAEGAAAVPAAEEVRTKLDAEGSFTLTLASLASGSSRQSSMVANPNGRPAAIVYLRIRSGAVAPTAATTYEVYLLRGDTNATPYRSDGAGAADAAITIENAQLLGTIAVTATANKDFFGDFDTSPLGPLGAEWGIAVKNQSGQALNATEANHLKRFVTYVPEIQ